LGACWIGINCQSTSHYNAQQIRNYIDTNAFEFDAYTVKYWGELSRYPGKVYGDFTVNDTCYFFLSNCRDSLFNIFCLSDTSIAYSYKIPYDLNVKFCAGKFSCFFYSPYHFILLDSKRSQLWEFFSGNFRLIKDMHNSLENNRLLLDITALSGELNITNDSNLIAPIVTYDIIENRSKGNHAVTMCYNLKTDSLTFKGSVYPVKRLDNLGLLDEMYQLCLGSNIVYSFDALSEIWYYNDSLRSLSQYPVRSGYQIKDVDLIPRSKRSDKDYQMQHMMRSGSYHHLTYDPYKKLYYYFYTLPLPEKNKDNFYTTDDDIRISLLVLDNSFKLISETLLPKECTYIYFSEAGPDGLFINFQNQRNVQSDGVSVLRIQYLGDSK
jgi:hypothetical protein